MSKNLLSELTSGSKLRYNGTLTNSTMFQELVDNTTPTYMPVINLANSGDIHKGFRAGLKQIAGPSKHFKSNLGLVEVSSYLNAHKDAICIFYDCEFGITPDTLKSYDIDQDRVIHSVITNIEELKFDIVQKLNKLKRGDKVIFFVDSLGNLPSIKEVEDAENEKSVADMTRAKQIKSLFRIITPLLTFLDVPCIVINHVYQETGMFAKTVVSGGTGVELSSNTIWTISRRKEKSGSDVDGYTFTIRVMKSRDVREESRFEFTVKFGEGIDKWSGLLPIALATGHVIKPKNGYYSRSPDLVVDDKKWRAKESSCEEFWKPVLEDPSFNEMCNKLFQLNPDNPNNTTSIEEEEI